MVFPFQYGKIEGKNLIESIILFIVYKMEVFPGKGKMENPHPALFSLIFPDLLHRIALFESETRNCILNGNAVPSQRLI